MDIFEIRRLNLNYFIEKEYDGQTKKFAAAVNKQPNYISRLKTGTSSGPTSNGRIGKRTASEFENILGLNSGDFDTKLWINDQEFKRKHIPNSDAERNNLILKVYPYLNNSQPSPGFTRIDLAEKEAVDIFGRIDLNEHYLYPPDGDTMAPTIPSSSVAVIDVSINKFINNGIYLFTFADILYFKRLAMGKAGVIHVISDNKLYITSDFQIEPNELNQLKIIGQFSKALFLDVIEN